MEKETKKIENGICVESTPGYEEWQNSAGQKHRLNGPAFYSKEIISQLITSGGTSLEETEYEWWINGLLHRLDGPAIYITIKKFYSDEPDKIISIYNIESWYNNGKLHRIGGPAIIDESTNLKEWRQNGKLHRLGGPARIDESKNLKEWWQNGKLHRLDGPARISNNLKYYFINNCELTYEIFMEYKNLIELNIMFTTTLKTMKKSQDDVGEVDGYYYIPKELMDSLLEKSKELLASHLINEN